jgi:hypothetical protein
MNKRLFALIPALVLAAGLTSGATATSANPHPQFIAHASTLHPEPAPVQEPAAIVQETVIRVSQPAPAEDVSTGFSGASTVDGLMGSIGYALPYGNCVNEPGVKRQAGNPISWAASTGTPYIGATFLFYSNHTGVVTGIWSNGDVEVRHQNYQGGQHRFPRSMFRGFI